MLPLLELGQPIAQDSSNDFRSGMLLFQKVEPDPIKLDEQIRL